MTELVEVRDLGSRVERHVGSSSITDTTLYSQWYNKVSEYLIVFEVSKMNLKKMNLHNLSAYPNLCSFTRMIRCRRNS